MNRSTIILLSILGVIVLIGMDACNRRNNMVTKDEAVQGSWAKVEAAYQQRADLIPNLVSTVKGAANFEQQTLTAVIEARSKATQVRVDAKSLTPEALQKFQAAQDGLSQTLGRLLMLTENYPQLRATESFRDLQSQLEGIENRIRTERNKFNDEVKGYNAYIRRFPSNIYAGLFGFTTKAYFESAAGSENAPKVDFEKAPAVQPEGNATETK